MKIWIFFPVFKKSHATSFCGIWFGTLRDMTDFTSLRFWRILPPRPLAETRSLTSQKRRREPVYIKALMHCLGTRLECRHRVFVKAWLHYNAMFYQTFICFCLSEARRLCLNHCSWLLDDVKWCWMWNIQFVCHAISRNLCYFFINVS